MGRKFHVEREVLRWCLCSLKRRRRYIFFEDFLIELTIFCVFNIFFVHFGMPK
ncbi:hypothetical protein IC582_016084 [Cucumis melo]